MNIDYTYKVESVAELPGHEECAWYVAWNPTKPLLASCSADKTVRMYAYHRRRPPYEHDVTLSGSKDKHVQGDSTDSNDELVFTHTSTIMTGHTKTVRGLGWAPSGKTLATASFDANIGIWEQELAEDELEADEAEGEGEGESESERNGRLKKGEWECMSLLEGHETECKSVAYSGSGTLLASCSRDKTVWIWEVHPDSDFECMSVLMEHSQDVKCVAWHPTEEILASASYDDTIKLYMDDPSEDWFCFATLKGHSSTVWSLAFAPGGRYLASSSDDRTVRIWKRITQHEWECVLVLEGHERSVFSVSWGADPEQPTHNESQVDSLGWLASTGGDGRILVWALQEPPADELSGDPDRRPPISKLIARLEGAHGVRDVNAVAWCPREGHRNLLATAGDDGMARVWRVVSSECI